jgi:hypothetical protein
LLGNRWLAHIEGQDGVRALEGGVWPASRSVGADRAVAEEMLLDLRNALAGPLMRISDRPEELPCIKRGLRGAGSPAQLDQRRKVLIGRTR